MELFCRLSIVMNNVHFYFSYEIASCPKNVATVSPAVMPQPTNPFTRHVSVRTTVDWQSARGEWCIVKCAGDIYIQIRMSSKWGEGLLPRSSRAVSRSGAILRDVKSAQLRARAPGEPSRLCPRLRIGIICLPAKGGTNSARATTYMSLQAHFSRCDARLLELLVKVTIVSRECAYLRIYLEIKIERKRRVLRGLLSVGEGKRITCFFSFFLFFSPSPLFFIYRGEIYRRYEVRNYHAVNRGMFD